MSNPYNEDKENIRAKIMGLGEKAGRKSYYPQLQSRIDEVERNRQEIQKKSSDLLDTLNELEDARRRSEENEKKFRTLFESITDGILVADTMTMCFVMNNQAACRMLGCESKCTLDAHFSALFDEEKTKELLSFIGTIRGDETVMFEMPVRRLAGDFFFGEIRISRLELDGKECFMLIIRDITENKKAREQLAHNRKMDAVGQLAGGVAHDFNNMLSGIIGAAEMLGISLDHGGDLSKKLVGLIMEAAQSASDLTNKLLAFSRKTAESTLLLDLHETIRAATELLERSIDKKIRIIFEPGASKSRVLGDFTQLQNLFLNLGINASHAMPAGGSLWYRTMDRYLNPSACSSLPFELRPGDYVEVEVGDTGCGISGDNIDKIFEPFFTTKKEGKGTGLGLSAAYGAIRQHKGAITVNSKVGEGTIFTMFFPVSEEEKEKTETVSEAVRGSGLIMVVDDEEMIRSTAEIFLSEMGYEVILAKNGLEALEIIKKRNGFIDLVILDMIMPEMNGHECFVAMKKIKPDLKVIFSTGYMNEPEFERLKEEGIKTIILKPYRYSELSRVVAEALIKI